MKMTEILSPRSANRVTFSPDLVQKKIISLPFDEISLPFDEPTSEPVVIQAILEDEMVRKVIEEHKEHLRHLVSNQRTPLYSPEGRNHGSLRSIISKKIDSCSISGKHLEQDITEPTEDLTEFSISDLHFDGELFFDQRALDLFDEESAKEEEDCFQPPEPVKPTPSAGDVEVAPGVFLPFRGAAETWQAIKYGCTTPTSCQHCQADLHVIEDAEHIVCPDCWMVGPVEQRMGDIPLEFDGTSDNHGLGLGVKADEILQWVGNEEHSL
jgi:hypothetical protein